MQPDDNAKQVVDMIQKRDFLTVLLTVYADVNTQVTGRRAYCKWFSNYETRLASLVSQITADAKVYMFHSPSVYTCQSHVQVPFKIIVFGY